MEKYKNNNLWYDNDQITLSLKTTRLTLLYIMQIYRYYADVQIYRYILYWVKRKTVTVILIHMFDSRLVTICLNLLSSFPLLFFVAPFKFMFLVLLSFTIIYFLPKKWRHLQLVIADNNCVVISSSFRITAISILISIFF